MRYRKRPITVDAIQWTITRWTATETTTNYAEIEAWSAQHGDAQRISFLGNRLHIDTLEGVMTARVNDWIVRGIQGEYYPVKPDIFEATYEPVDDSPDATTL